MNKVRETVMMRETLSQTGETQEALVLHTLPFKVMGVAHILNQTICLMQMPLVFLLTMDLDSNKLATLPKN